MPTSLQIDLSAQMQTWLSAGGAGNGVSAYAILYGSTVEGGTADNPLAWQKLVTNGTVEGGGSVTLDLTAADRATLYGGKVYFIIQSIDDAAHAIDPTSLKQSAINWTNAASLDYRFDSMEVALTGHPGDAANLTSIGGFGIGMTLEASTGSRSYALSAADVFNDLTAAMPPLAGKPAVTTFNAGGLKDQAREAVSPAVAVVPENKYPLYTPANWDNYIEALKTTATPIIVNGYFNGAGDLQAGGPVGTPVIWRNAGFFSYALEWRASDDSFWLKPTEGSQIQGAIKLSKDALADSIYATHASVELYETVGAKNAFEIYPGTTEMNTGANNAWGKVLQQLTIGLTAGYLESTATSPNGAVTTGIDLNRNYNWDPSYAFGNSTHTSLGSDVFRWDPYAKVFFENTNSYGTQYADALMAAYAEGEPLLPTYDGNANVTAMKVTLFADSETPTGYTPPVIHDYVGGSGAGGKYEIAKWHDGNGYNIALNFNPGDSLAQSLVLKDDVALSIRILTGYSGDTPQWQEIAIGGPGQTPWQNWTFGHANGVYSLTGNGGAGQTSQSLILTGPPMADSGVGWYQIVVKSNNFEKVYNLYTTTFTPAATPDHPNPIPQFKNFAAEPSTFGVDGLASLIPGALAAYGGGLQTFSVGVTGVTPTLDLSLMKANTAAAFLNNQVAATAPVVGILDHGHFKSLPGQTANVHQGNLSATSHTGLLAFGWTGLNQAPDTKAWTQTFTNLIQGHSIAVVDVSLHGGAGSIVPLYAKADLAGGWHTALAHQFGNGTYDVTMTAYAAKAQAPNTPDLSVPLTKESFTLSLTVQLNKLALGGHPDGRSLTLVPDGSETAGNWIHITADAGDLPKAVSIALYATDADGNPLGADGQPAASIEDAILGWVGAVGGDSGATLLEGEQSIFLHADRQLHFARVDARGDVTAGGPVSIHDDGDGSFTIGVDGITLDAEVRNTLSAEMQAAAVQRVHGMPLVHVEHDDVLEVALTGSSFNRNTLGFVRLDLDHASGALSLDGIAYGDSDAFRQAVRGSLDAGYSITAGGDFAQSTRWTVAGETGFYAPVLITSSGELFLPGDANRGGYEYLRTLGANSFGFEDLAFDQASDFDYGDMVLTLRSVPDTAML